jgi:hypothetical protein
VKNERLGVCFNIDFRNSAICDCDRTVCYPAIILCAPNTHAAVPIEIRRIDVNLPSPPLISFPCLSRDTHKQNFSNILLELDVSDDNSIEQAIAILTQQIDSLNENRSSPTVA